MKRLYIKKSWYYSVGSRFGWQADGLDPVGLGIEKHWLKENKAILVNVDKFDYYLDCEQALRFIAKYKCYETIGEARIGYVSQALFRRLENLSYVEKN